MATETRASSPGAKHQVVSEAEHTAGKEANTFKQFFTKINNDWVMIFASGLAFNLLTSIIPIVIAIISILGFIFGSQGPTARNNLLNNIENVFPPPIKGSTVLGPALNTLSKEAGFLSIIAIVLAVFAGSRLFVALEGYFDIIYHTRPRNAIKQNLMAFAMLLVFVILTPLMVFAASGPALVFSLLQATPLSQIPYIGFIFSLGGILGGLLVAWILFEAIYVVVPHQHISFRNSWRGALVAAIALQIYLVLFPFYVAHFLTSDTGTAGFAIILLFFFYYFAVILLLGAEINAFFAEGVRVTPANLAVMIHELTSHLPTSEQAVQEEAAVSHKGEEPKSIHPKHETDATVQSHNGTALREQDSTEQAEHTHRPKKKRTSSQASSRAPALIEAVAGTALAFFVTLLRMRRKS